MRFHKTKRTKDSHGRFYPVNWFIPNSKGPNWWCWVFHSHKWIDNSPQWARTVRHSYEVFCRICGRCWVRPFSKKRD